MGRTHLRLLHQRRKLARIKWHCLLFCLCRIKTNRLLIRSSHQCIQLNSQKMRKALDLIVWLQDNHRIKNQRITFHSKCSLLQFIRLRFHQQLIHFFLRLLLSVHKTLLAQTFRLCYAQSDQRQHLILFVLSQLQY